MCAITHRFTAVLSFLFCSYVQGGSLELTLEISCCKHPPQHTLRQFWAENIRPLIRLMEETHRGVKGKALSRHSMQYKTLLLNLKRGLRVHLDLEGFCLHGIYCVSAILDIKIYYSYKIYKIHLIQQLG